MDSVYQNAWHRGENDKKEALGMLSVMVVTMQMLAFILQNLPVCGLSLTLCALGEWELILKKGFERKLGHVMASGPSDTIIPN